MVLPGRRQGPAKALADPCYSSTWVLATGSTELLDTIKQFPSAAEWPEDGAKQIVFTDDYSNLFQLLDLQDEWKNLQDEMPSLKDEWQKLVDWLSTIGG